jgi:hypothetical protein
MDYPIKSGNDGMKQGKTTNRKARVILLILEVRAWEDMSFYWNNGELIFVGLSFALKCGAPILR